MTNMYVYGDLTIVGDAKLSVNVLTVTGTLHLVGSKLTMTSKEKK